MGNECGGEDAIDHGHGEEKASPYLGFVPWELVRVESIPKVEESRG